MCLKDIHYRICGSTLRSLAYGDVFNISFTPNTNREAIPKKAYISTTYSSDLVTFCKKSGVDCGEPDTLVGLVFAYRGPVVSRNGRTYHKISYPNKEEQRETAEELTDSDSEGVDEVDLVERAGSRDSS